MKKDDSEESEVQRTVVSTISDPYQSETITFSLITRRMNCHAMHAIHSLNIFSPQLDDTERKKENKITKCNEFGFSVYFFALLFLFIHTNKLSEIKRVFVCYCVYRVRSIEFDNQ